LPQTFVHEFNAEGEEVEHIKQSLDHVEEQVDSPMSLLKAAKSMGRPVVYVSMGTVITGDSQDWGWNGRVRSGGDLKGLTGRELCRAAWGGAFDAFGSQTAEDGPLLLVSLGPQPDALGEGLEAPANSCCLPVMPQVDLLKAGVDVFLTHGGQNSFTEALVTSTPVVVCPCFADQHKNAARAEKLGVGHHVFRPYPLAEEAAAACAAHCSRIARALREVSSDPRFRIAAQGCAERLRKAGGVARAVELIHQVALKSAAADQSLGKA